MENPIYIHMNGSMLVWIYTHRDTSSREEHVWNTQTMENDMLIIVDPWLQVIKPLTCSLNNLTNPRISCTQHLTCLCIGQRTWIHRDGQRLKPTATAMQAKFPRGEGRNVLEVAWKLRGQDPTTWIMVRGIIVYTPLGVFDVWSRITHVYIYIIFIL